MVIKAVAGLLGAVDNGDEMGEEWNVDSGAGLSGRSLSVASSSSASSLDRNESNMDEISAAAEEGLLCASRGELGLVDTVSNALSAHKSPSERVSRVSMQSEPSFAPFDALVEDVERVVGPGTHEKVKVCVDGTVGDCEKSRGPHRPLEVSCER
jgi:hypothetical protein